MKANKELYQERRKRIEDAIALKKTDRTPTMAWVDAFAATYKKAPMSRFSNNYMYQSKIILETIKDFPDLDCPEGSFTPPKSVAAALLRLSRPVVFHRTSQFQSRQQTAKDAPQRMAYPRSFQAG